MTQKCKVNPKLESLLVELDGLVVDPNNARLHSDRNVATIAKSLDTYGQQKPISLSPDGTTVFAGNGTVIAARSLKWTHIAAVPFDNDSKELQDGWKIADNRSAELAAWDMDALAREIGKLSEGALDIEAIGFSDTEIAAILDGFGDGSSEVSDLSKEWEGMPGYEHEDHTSFRRITVHFKSHADAAKFGKAIGQGVSEQTRSLWFPPDEIGHRSDKYWGDGEQEGESE